MAQIYYNRWRIGMWFTPIQNEVPNTRKTIQLSHYEVGEKQIDNEVAAWARMGFELDDFSSDGERRYLDNYIKGHGIYTIIADLMEYEEDVPEGDW